MRDHLSKRLIVYFLGLLTMTIEVALSVRSNLGMSPVSSIPYMMTCIWGIEMGRTAIIFHCFLVLLQMILLRRNFEPVNLLQVLIGIVFGYFTTFCNWGVSFLPTPENLVIRLLMVLISTVIIASGIFMYLPPNIMPLAGGGAMKAVPDVTDIAFLKVKIGFDITMVVISLISCPIFIRGLGSVGIGTIVAAFLVGSILNVIENFLGNYRDKWLGIKN